MQLNIELFIVFLGSSRCLDFSVPFRAALLKKLFVLIIKKKTSDYCNVFIPRDHEGLCPSGLLVTSDFLP